MSKQCTQCKLTRPLTEFTRHRLGKDGRHPWCKVCRRTKARTYYKAKPSASHISKTDNARCRMYGIGSAAFADLLAKHGGQCAICGNEESFVDGRSGKVRRLSIDHCHDTLAVRGLLCHDCNTSLGHFKDSPHLLRAAANYLERSAATIHPLGS